MNTPASVKSHPIHVMLVGFPIGLWTFSLICDLIYYARGTPEWKLAAYYTLGGGIVGALVAAVPGLIDLLAIKDAGSRRIGLWHMGINLVALAIFGASFWLRRGDLEADLPAWLSLIGVAGIFVAGWLGGELVHVRHVSVEDPGKPATVSGQLR